MRLSTYLCDTCILEDLAATDKAGALDALAEAAANQGLDFDLVTRLVRERERLGTTALGHGVAIPHAKIPGLPEMVVVFGRSTAGIDCGAPDGAPCRLFFMVLAPEGNASLQLAMLGTIARLVKDETFRQALLDASNAAELSSLLFAA